MRNVPFGNSIFQNQHFTAGQETPERRYRHCLLQINQKLNALQECEFRRKRIDINIKEIKYKLDSDLSSFERERIEIDLEEKQFQLENEIKLIEDAVIELATYEKESAILPDFTREEFEKAEFGYWKKRLLLQAKQEITSIGVISLGTIESLNKIGIVVGKNQDGQIAYQEENTHALLS